MNETTQNFAASLTPRLSWTPAVRWSGAALAAVAWASGVVFGAYILAFYGGALIDGLASQWNRRPQPPNLFDQSTPWANVGIGLHFLTGAILLGLGPVQLLGAIRARWPRLHRWSGRLYASAAVLTGLGGLVFIAAKGTIGGAQMSIAFALYGLALILAAVNTARHARARRLDLHRAWAIRLYALVIGSWLYRIENSGWRLLTGWWGHTATFDGPFDQLMVYFFFVPNLILAEAYLRAGRPAAGPAAQVAIAALLTAATVFLALLTVLLTLRLWGPPIARLAGG